MARKAKRKAPRRSNAINLLGVAEAFAITNLWTDAALNVNPISFLTGVTTKGYNPGGDGGSIITLPELLGAGPGGIGGNYGNYADNFGEAVWKNIGGYEGLIMTGMKTAGVSIGFRVAKKVTSRARSLINRQILKPFGMTSMVRL